MENQGQPPVPEQERSEQQGYGWQYDQDDATEIINQSSQKQQKFQQPIHDMGTSLGYGQGMEFQYFDAPQPSQPIEVLRQERLQQLREERMRRQQRRMNPGTSYLSWTGRLSMGPLAKPKAPVSPPPIQRTGENTSRPLTSSPLPEQMSPILSLPSRPLVDSTKSKSLKDHASEIVPAVAPAQDTGMIQRVQIGRATLILTAAFVASRVLGILRTSMFAFVFGTDPSSAEYLQAFLIPDLIFNIVAGGALSSAFIPVFTNYMIGEKDEKTAWHIASSALNIALAIMSFLALIAIIFARQLVPLYNPGRPPAFLDSVASLTRIMLLQAIILGGGVIVNSVLNARQDFRLPAIGTVLYNVGLIVGLIPGIFLAFRGHRDDTFAVYAATWGVVLGALMQVAVQIPGLLRVGMKYTPAFDWKQPGVRQIGRQMVPRIINAGMLYCSTFVDRSLLLLLVTVVGANLVDGLVTQYVQALQLVLLPLGIFGMAVSTAAFPTLAENVTKGRFDRVRNTIQETLRSILFLSIPSSVGLMVLGLPIIQVLLQHGRYTLTDARATAVPLAFFAVGLAGLAAVEILTRAFYAMRDSKTPVIVSVGQFVFKIALSLILINVAVFGAQWGMGALAFATSVAGLLEAGVLFWLLHQRVGGLQMRAMGIFIGRVLAASIAMGAGLIVLSFILDLILVTTNTSSLGPGGTLLALIKLLIELFVGVFIYIRSARFLGIEEMGPVKRVLDRLKLSWI